MMSDTNIYPIYRILKVSELMDYLVRDECDKKAQIEIVNWETDCDGENCSTYLEYGYKVLYATMLNGKLRLIIGESAKVQCEKDMAEWIEDEKRRKAAAAKLQEAEIAKARAILAKYGVGLVDEPGE